MGWKSRNSPLRSSDTSWLVVGDPSVNCVPMIAVVAVLLVQYVLPVRQKLLLPVNGYALLFKTC